MLLTIDALRAAYWHNRANHGCAGADGVTLTEFEHDLPIRLAKLYRAVADESYFAWPMRRVVIEKRPGSDETRTLHVASVGDRVLQTAVATYLEPLLEREFNACSFGYRRGRGVRMAVEQVRTLFHEGYTWLVDTDVDDFFDQVARSTVLDRLATLVPDETAVRLCHLWLDFASWDGVQLTRPATGIPQGAIVSPMLANLCLDRLDDRMEQEGIQMVRYSDDFVLLAKSEPAAKRALAIAEETLEALHLRLKESKTRVTRFRDGFRFLGVIFLKDLLATPYRTGARQRSKILSSAPAIAEAQFPPEQRRPLRGYRLV